MTSTLPGVRPDFGLDEAVNLGSIFLRGMLSKKVPAGLSNSYETPRQPSNGGDVDNEAPQMMIGGICSSIYG